MKKVSMFDYKVYEPTLTERFKAWHKSLYGWEPCLGDSKVCELYEAFSVGYDNGYRAPDLPTTNRKLE